MDSMVLPETWTNPKGMIAEAIRAEAIRAEAIRAEAIRAEAIRAEAIRAEAINVLGQHDHHERPSAPPPKAIPLAMLRCDSGTTAEPSRGKSQARPRAQSWDTVLFF